MSADAAVMLCTQGDIEYVLSVIGLQLGLDDDRSGTISSPPESTYLSQCIEFATAECNSYLFRRYDPNYMANSSAVREAVAVRAALRARRHRTDPVSESLQVWADEVLEWYEKVRDAKADIAGTPERSPARPGVINQRHDIRYPNPSRLQTNQSTVPKGKRPFGIDFYDNAVAGL